jgi:hypothetical protein
MNRTAGGVTPKAEPVELIEGARRWEGALLTLGVALACIALIAATAGPIHHLFDGVLSIFDHSPSFPGR